MLVAHLVIFIFVQREHKNTQFTTVQDSNLNDK